MGAYGLSPPGVDLLRTVLTTGNNIPQPSQGLNDYLQIDSGWLKKQCMKLLLGKSRDGRIKHVEVTVTNSE